MTEKHSKPFSSGNPQLQDFLTEKSKNHEQVSDFQYKHNQENIYLNPLLLQIQKKVIDAIDVKIVGKIKDPIELKGHIEQLLENICEKEFPTLTNKERLLIIHSLLQEFNGLGPLQSLMLDETVTEIMVNGPNDIYIEKNGLLILSDVRFRDNEHVIQTIDKIVAPLGRRIDESSPMVDARLPDGSRVNAIIPPISLIGPVLTIRKFPKVPLTIEKLIINGTLDEHMSNFLKKAVIAKANIIVAGGTGSGKTTFLNVLSSNIPNKERIITIEDAAELRLQQHHVIPLEARPANLEGKGEITIRDLVKNSLRMRPNRIIIGEVRGSEALDMLQAMNTGHSGSLSTIHANSARDAISRLETMVLYTGIDFPIRAIREQIQSAIDIIVYLERLTDGSRKVTQISEIVGMEGDTIVLQDIYFYEKKGKTNGKLRGEFKYTSIRPKIFDKFENMGVKL